MEHSTMAASDFDILEQTRELVNAIPSEQFASGIGHLIIKRAPDTLPPEANRTGIIRLMLIHSTTGVVLHEVAYTKCGNGVNSSTVVRHLAFNLVETHQHLQKCHQCRETYERLNQAQYNPALFGLQL